MIISNCCRLAESLGWNILVSLKTDCSSQFQCLLAAFTNREKWYLEIGLPLLVVYNSNLLLLAEFMLEFYILFDLLGTAKPSLKRSLNRALTILMCGFIM